MYSEIKLYTFLLLNDTEVANKPVDRLLIIIFFALKHK